MYSCHSILECYDLFSVVKLSIRSFCYIKINKILGVSVKAVRVCHHNAVTMLTLLSPGGIHPHPCFSLCCAKTVNGRKLKLSDFSYKLVSFSNKHI